MKNFLKYFPLKLTIQNLLEINQIIHTPMTLKFQTVQDYYILGQQEKVNFRGDPDHHEIPQLCYSISMQLHDRLLPTYGTTKSRGFSLRTEHAKKTTLKKVSSSTLDFRLSHCSIFNKKSATFLSPILLHYCALLLDRSPAFLTSNDFIRSNKIIRTKWLIHVVISQFVLMIL